MLELRKATADDVESIKQIYVAIVGAELEMAEFNRIQSAGGVIVAELNGELIGFGGIDIAAEEQLKWLYVLPQQQRTGLGSTILQHLETIATEAGLSRLRLHATPDAVTFYSRYGYREDAQSSTPHNHDGLAMTKNLNRNDL